MNVVGLVNDLYDLIKSNVNKDQVGMMVETLNILEDNLVIDGEIAELNKCYGIHEELDEALEKYFSEKDDEENYYDED